MGVLCGIVRAMDTPSFKWLGNGIGVMYTIMYWNMAVHNIVSYKAWAPEARLTGNKGHRISATRSASS